MNKQKLSIEDIEQRVTDIEEEHDDCARGGWLSDIDDQSTFTLDEVKRLLAEIDLHKRQLAKKTSAIAKLRIEARG